MRRLLALGLGALALVLGPAGGSTAQSGGSVSFGLVEPPPAPHDDPRGEFYVVDHAEPGDVVRRRVRVTNSTDADLDVSLYAGSATIRDGAFHFGEGRSGSELTRWTEVRPQQVPVASGTSAEGTVVIRVPAGTAPGERYGVVWAELPARAGAGAVVNRIGIRIYLSVGEGDPPRSEVAIERFTPRRDDEGRPVVDVTLRNPGGLAYDVAGRIVLEQGDRTVRSAFGTTLAPGDEGEATTTVDRRAVEGRWAVTASVTANGARERARAQITFPADPGEVGTTVPADPVTDGRSPVPAAAAALLIALVGVVLLRRGRASAPALS